MPTLTLQEIFNKALFGIRAQGVPSGSRMPNGGYWCAYRVTSPDGKTLACSVGQLIPDCAYDPALDQGEVKGEEGVPVAALLGIEGAAWPTQIVAFERAMATGGVDIANPRVRELLVAMQEVHDDAAIVNAETFMESFEQAMERVARRFGLTYSPAPATV